MGVWFLKIRVFYKMGVFFENAGFVFWKLESSLKIWSLFLENSSFFRKSVCFFQNAAFVFLEMGVFFNKRSLFFENGSFL